MQIDPNNPIVKLCAQGMSLEGEGKKEEALQLFERAWNEASSDFEKFTSAHYVARHQKTAADKLHWDTIALNSAIKSEDENLKAFYPSLYLNIAKCHEDLNDFSNAKENYDLAFSFCHLLSDDGYGKMIKGGILNGLDRVRNN